MSEDFEEFIEYYLRKSNETFLNQLKEKLIKENYPLKQINEISQISAILLEDYFIDIIDMIKITSLKQKFSFESETVSSETEIAFISKSNYFEWIRKEDEKLKYKKR